MTQLSNVVYEDICRPLTVGIFPTNDAAPSLLDDAEPSLLEAANAAIGEAPHLRGRNIRLETEHNRIVITGTVPSFFLKQVAQEAIRSVVGVNEICNEIRVIAVG